METPVDCIEMKRQGQEALRERLRGMTREQKLGYWAERSKEMREEAERLRISERKPE
jgi:hypothetical protein